MTTLPSIRMEGGLLGPDTLDQLLAGELRGQKPSDFGLDGRRLTEEIGAVFADARALWGVFQRRLARLRPDDPATTLTRDLWMVPFLQLLGYEPRLNPRAWVVDGLTFAVSHRAGAAEDAPPLHIVGARQALGRVAASGRPRLSPHALVQEYLNRTEHLWGLVANGLTLRLLRDSTWVSRQAYVEFDLAGIFEEGRFQDFTALYRLLHRTRLPRGTDDAPTCLLEQYHAHTVEQGGRVRERLRDGVEQCLTILADGFLRHPANDALRRRLADTAADDERLTPAALYRDLLRLVYRFLFLLVSEERGLISADPLYREHYGVARLRRRLERRAADDEHDDLWRSLQVLWRALRDEKLAAFLGAAPLNGELFEPLVLDDVLIANRDLLDAFARLVWYEDRRTGARRRVNYAALDVEELGSVYESLLDFHPRVAPDAAGRPTFSLGHGSERKTTGSYYTPPQLVGELIRSALEPVIAERLAGASGAAEKERALLAVKVCDPACGSGHFLLAAARRLGKELARVRTGEDEPSPERVREATRAVMAHCLYGVDKNPLAVELCRVALWLEGHTAGKPLAFLDHRIRCGDALLGVFDLGAVEQGVPDAAFDALEGDDRTVARVAARQNQRERAAVAAGQAALPFAAVGELAARGRELDALEDDSPEAVRRKKERFRAAQADPARRRRREACDLWCAAFFQPFTRGRPVITTAAVAEYLAGRPVDGRLTGLAAAVAAEHGFFHWRLEFPEVFEAGGFDVVLSNPPWEHVELKEQEFFAGRNERITNAANKSERTRLIKQLKTENPALFEEYLAHLRRYNATRQVLTHGGRYPLTGRGRVNTYAVLTELARALLKPDGRAGVIVPTGIATDDTTKFFFQDLVQSGALVSLYDFENRKGVFPAIDSRLKFCLLTMQGRARARTGSEFLFFAETTDDLRRPEKRFTLTPEDIALLNPNTGNCPTFRTQADAELTKAIYRRVPVLWREKQPGEPERNSWKLHFSQGLFNMATDSRHFRSAPELEQEGCRREGNVFVGEHDRYLPLYEAKMLHQFDHRWATYTGATAKHGDAQAETRDVTDAEKADPGFAAQPRYWIREDVVEAAVPPAHVSTRWFLGWRDICRSTDERTLIASAVPQTAVGHTFLLLFPQLEGIQRLWLLAALNSFAADYVARQKLSGTHLAFFTFRQLAIPSPGIFDQGSDHWGEFITPRVLELVYTAADLTPLARDCGDNGPPFRWNPDRRFEIRCELDAAFFHLYLPATAAGDWRPARVADGGVRDETEAELAALKAHFPTPRDAVAYILDQFPLVRRKDEVRWGEYRTKARILAIYDRMLEARRGRSAYRSLLDPPPGCRRPDAEGATAQP